MPIRHAIWKIGEKPESLAEISLPNEALLERMILEDPSILSDQWMLIGHQVRTIHGGIIDLLALNQNGQIIVIELKRDQTPREVVAQALDYASWVKNLEANDIAGIYDRFSQGKNLDAAFEERFGFALDGEQLNDSHQIVIVASSLDPSTERIVNYLSDKDVAINVIFFQVFKDGKNQYLSKAWLIDPAETEDNASAANFGKTEWNGEYYVSFGQDDNRDWEEAVKYGFISAGFGSWYTKTLFALSPGDRVWVNIPRRGYVGVGRVIAPAVRAKDFQVTFDGMKTPFLQIAGANYLREFANDEERSEYFVPVEWIATKPLNEAVSEVGFFGNQNTVCRPKTTKWNHTVERLKKNFNVS